MTDRNDLSIGVLAFVGSVVFVALVFVFFVLALADSFLSWGLMPDAIERFAHRILLWLIPME